MKDIIYNSYFPEFPVVLNRIVDNDGEVFVEAICLKKDVKQITLLINDEKKTYTDFSGEIISLPIETDVSIYDTTVRLFSCKFDESELFVSDYDEAKTSHYLPVSTLKGLKKFYINKIQERTSLKSNDVKAVFEQKNDYYHCVCGHSVFGTECPNCHTKREVLREVKDELDDEYALTNKLNKHLIMGFSATLLIMVIDIIIGTFTHYFFYNDSRSEGFGVFLRIFVPIIMMVCSLTALYFNGKKKNQLVIAICLIVELISIIFLNILMFVSVVKYSYLILIVSLLDSYLVYLLTLRKKTRYYFALPIVAIIVIFSISFGYRKNEIKYIDKSWTVVVKTKEETYNAPSKINNVTIETLQFVDGQSESIKTLNVSKSIYNVSILNNAYLCNLETINLDSSNKKLSLVDNVLYNDKDEIVLIPTNSKKIIIKDGVKELPYRCFYNCILLEEVVLPDSLVNIKAHAFDNCINLKSFVLSDSSNVKMIYEEAFKNCVSLKTVVLNKNLKTVLNSLFLGCNSLESIKVPFLGKNRNTSEYLCYLFGGNMYDDAQYVPNTLKTIEVFDQDHISNVAFINCTNIERVIYSCSVNSFGARVFEGCSGLKTVELKGEFKTIGMNSFINCTSLERVILPNSVTTIESNAFKNCTSISEVVYNGDRANLLIEDGNDTIKDKI